MTLPFEGFPQETQSPEQPPLSPIQEVFAHNAAVLATDISLATAQDSFYYKDIEGYTCYQAAVALYVNRSTGRIEGVGSHEKLSRVKASMSPHHELDPALESLATGLPMALLEDPNTVRVYAWHEFGRPVLTDSGANVLRPASWARNSRVRLSGSYLSRHPLEQLIPDDIERGIFLKSIDDHNNTPESPVRAPASL